MSDLLTNIRLLLNIKGTDDLKDFQRQIKTTAQSLKDFGDGMTKAGRTLSVAVTAPLTIFGALAVKNFNDAERASAKLRNTLAGVGSVVGETFDQIRIKSESLSKGTLFNTDQIEEASAVLAGFGNIAKKEFDQAQASIADFAARAGTDVVQAAELLGRALADPALAARSLRSAGIVLSDQQQKQIRIFTEMGQVAKAQAVILDQVQLSTHGLARELAATGTGPIQQLKKDFHDMSEEVGGLIVKSLDPTIKKLRELVGDFRNLSPATKESIVSIGLIANVAGPALASLGQIATGVGALTLAFVKFRPILLGLLESTAVAVAALVGVGLAIPYQIYQSAASAGKKALADAQQNATFLKNLTDKLTDEAITKHNAEIAKIKEKQQATEAYQIKLASLQSDIAKIAQENDKLLGVNDPEQATKNAEAELGPIREKIKQLQLTKAELVAINKILDEHKILQVDFGSDAQIQKNVEDFFNKVQRIKDGLKSKFDQGIISQDELTTQTNEALASLRVEAQALGKGVDSAFQTTQVKEFKEKLQDLKQKLLDVRPGLSAFALFAKDVLTQASSGVASGFADAFLAIEDGTKSASKAFSDFAAQVLKDIQRIIIQTLIMKAIQQGINAIFDPSQPVPTNSPTVESNAEGGLISGPGSGTSDSILARLSNGEFVLRAAAVKAIGTDNLRALNDLRLHKFRLPQFAMGGLIAGLANAASFTPQVPRYADGGLVGQIPGGGISPTIQIINSGTPKDAQAKIDPRTGITQILLEDLQKNGPIAQGMQKTFKVKR